MSTEKLRDPRTYETPLCAQTSPTFFFLDDDDDPTIPEEALNKSYATALEICRMCDHRTECAEWGIRHERWGVWGGLTPPQRVQIRRTRKITLSQ